MTFSKLTKEVKTLPEEQRASLASFLLSTLQPPSYGVSDEEVERRIQEAEKDPSVMISYSELKRRLGR